MVKKILSVLLAAAMMLCMPVSAAWADEGGQTPASPVSSDLRYSALILDITGSMSGKPIIAEKEAAKKFCQSVLAADGQNYVAIVYLDTHSDVGVNFTNNIDELTDYIDNIRSSGTTNTNEAVVVADKILAEAPENAVKNIILCSDGLPNRGSTLSNGRYTSADYSSYKYANAVYATCSGLKDKYNIYALGFFHSLSGKNLTFGRKFLSDLQNAGYYDVTNPDDLEFTFGEVAGDLTGANNKTVVRIACPVDIEFYDANSKLLGTIANNVCNDADSSDKIEFYMDGEVKCLDIKGDGSYTVKFTGTGSGTMTYAIQNIRSKTNDIVSEQVFSNVVLAYGKKFTSTITVENKIAAGVLTQSIPLYVVDDNGTIAREVLADGSEKEIAAAGEQPKAPVTYNVIFNGSDNGVTVTGDRTAGSLMTVKVPFGYEAKVTYGGRIVGSFKEGTGSFIMPAGDIAVNVEYDQSVMTIGYGNSYIYSYDKDVDNYITTNSVRGGMKASEGVITVKLGKKYAGKSVVLYSGRKSTSVKVDEAVLDENGNADFTVKSGKIFTLIVE